MSAPRLLIIDDEPMLRRVLELALADRGFHVDATGTASDGIARAARGDIDVVLTDLQLPDRSGLDVLAALREQCADLPVILITGFGTVETAVQAMKLGAYDYVLKPFQVDDIENVLRRAVQQKRTERENAYLRDVAARDFEGIVGSSDAIRAVIDSIRSVADAPTTVLITGETGVGKELIARAIHAQSARRAGLFVPLNCAAIPSELLEAELFGVVRGAFTGAVSDRAGKFELADAGTLFLDEIGDMPAAMQPKLLRALQDKTVERIGAAQPVLVDTRVIAATHRDLAAMVAAGGFREDLFYRLNVFPIHVPPLRARREDIAPIARRLVERLGRSLGRARTLSDDALAVLEHHEWPGNVRELSNVLERAVLLSQSEQITPGDLLVTHVADTAAAPAQGGTLHAAMAAAEREAIQRALEQSGDNKTAAARLLGISVRALWYKLQKLGISA
ncbi:MAG TPA: sigma-54 dependent transcriptional regulator [Longimicrobiales bacterium]